MTIRVQEKVCLLLGNHYEVTERF